MTYDDLPQEAIDCFVVFLVDIVRVKVKIL